MSEVVLKAMERLSAKISGGYEGVARFVITGEGAIVLDRSGLRAVSESEDVSPDVSLIATRETFQALLEGRLKVTTAYMNGKLKVQGSIPAAMRLGTVLS